MMTRERLDLLTSIARETGLEPNSEAELIFEIERCWNRITELQEHNNGEVEKRRAIERDRDAYAAALAMVEHDQMCHANPNRNDGGCTCWMQHISDPTAILADRDERVQGKETQLWLECAKGVREELLRGFVFNNVMLSLSARVELRRMAAE